MNQFKSTLIFWIYFNANLLLAYQSTTNYDDVMSISPSKFLAQFKVNFSSNFCEERSPFIKCYEVDSKKCRNFVGSKLAQCANKFNIIKPIRVDVQGERIGEILGQCLGEFYIEKYKNLKIVNDYCERRNIWNSQIR